VLWRGFTTLIAGEELNLLAKQGETFAKKPFPQSRFACSGLTAQNESFGRGGRLDLLFRYQIVPNFLKSTSSIDVAIAIYP
jgi:hypothetical protein